MTRPKSIREDFLPTMLVSENVDIVYTIRNEFITLAEALCLMVPEGRERNLAYLRLQEACMWATKAVSLASPAQKENKEVTNVYE
jgi:hypothetical protein